MDWMYPIIGPSMGEDSLGSRGPEKGPFRGTQILSRKKARQVERKKSSVRLDYPGMALVHSTNICLDFNPQHVP